MRRFVDIKDESGTTLVELLVATSAGIVVMGIISLGLIVTMRETNRVTSHVEANQRARLTMGKIIEQLHSSCIAPQMAPIQEGSSGSSVTFVHQTGSAVSPTPIKSTISLTGTTLSQSNFEYESGIAPEWAFKTSASSTETLLTGVSQISSTVPVFRYYAYTNGKVSTTPLSVPLKENAETAVQVNVAFEAAPVRPTSNDANASTELQDSALLRLTPPAYSTTTADLPCE
jgi:hypothetical protein